MNGGLELWPRHLPTWLARHSLFKYTGRVDRAQAMLDAADTRPPLPPWLKDALQVAANALASGGTADRNAARDTLLGSLDGGGPLAAIGATMDLAALGETALALDVTEAFLLKRGPLIAGTAWQPGQVVHHDARHRFTNHLFLPARAAVRGQPRFTAIMRDVGMVNHWTRSGSAARIPLHATGGADATGRRLLSSATGHEVSRALRAPTRPAPNEPLHLRFSKAAPTVRCQATGQRTEADELARQRFGHRAEPGDEADGGAERLDALDDDGEPVVPVRNRHPWRKLPASPHPPRGWRVPASRHPSADGREHRGSGPRAMRMPRCCPLLNCTTRREGSLHERPHPPR